jgi:hypothetical protein
MRLFELPLPRNEEGHRCYELREKDWLVLNTGTFLRWRVTKSGYFCGTQHGLDEADHGYGIFVLPMRILKPLDTLAHQPENERSGRFCNFAGGYLVIKSIFEDYWFGAKVGHKSFFVRPARMPAPWEKTAYVGSKGIYFDFVPMKDESRITLFVLFDKENAKWRDEQTKSHATGMIEMWECEKESTDKPVKDGTFDGSEDLVQKAPRFDDRPRDLKKGWISTEMNEPFYVFEKADDYYFVTLTGKIYVAPHVSADPKKIERLIADLDSNSFATREEASKDLKAIGKRAQEALEPHLKTAISEEQKRRITDLLDGVKGSPDRETKLLWQDEERPVEKILFDQDKDKVYAFTKPNKDKRVYVFEITAKPQPRLFTGETRPDKPASIPGSARTFLEYARFVRTEK